MKKIKKLYFKKIIIACGLVVLIMGMAVFICIKMSSQKHSVNNSESASRAVSSAELVEIEKEYQKRSIDFFVSDVLPTFPEIHSEITDYKIANLHILTLKDQDTAWLVEAEYQDQLFLYLLHPGVARQLEHPMSSFSGEDANCEVIKVLTAGNEYGLGRNLKEVDGYLLLSSINCIAYGGGESVSAYSLATGEKIKFTGKNFSVGTHGKGISDSGNALGRLMGVYGYSQPTVVVKYGLSDNTPDDLREVSVIGFFDLQTGKLISTQTFH